MEVNVTCPYCGSSGDETFEDEYSGNGSCGDCGKRWTLETKLEA